MKKIYKYQLEIIDYQHLTLPKGSEIISIANQNENIVVWAIVNTEVKDKETFNIFIYGTGHPLPEMMDDLVFLGTVQISPFVWHVFYN